jgi:hypothetical protein
MSDEELLRRVEQRLRHHVHPKVWQYLVNRGWASEVRQAAELGDDVNRLIGDVVAEIRAIETLVVDAGSRRVRTGPKTQYPASTDHRHKALSRILAISAGRLPGVVKFRDEVLGGVLLKEGEVEEWLRTQGDPEQDWHDPATGLFFHDPEEGPVIDTRGWDSRSLRHLKQVARELTLRCSWSEEASVLFVLTDAVPSVALATVETFWRREGEPLWLYPAQRTVRLEVNVRVKPRDVAVIYAQARSEMTDLERDKSLSEKHAQLAVFAAERTEDQTWEQAMTDWNRYRPQDAYERVRLFARDCRAAYRRVTGTDLLWGGRDRRRSAGRLSPETVAVSVLDDSRRRASSSRKESVERAVRLARGSSAKGSRKGRP